MSVFKPHYIFEKTTKITPEFLKELGITNLLLDVDNTLTTHDNPDPIPGIPQWIEEMKSAGIKMVIISNNNKERVEPFAAKLGLPFTSMSCKPLPFGYKKGMKILGSNRHNTAMVGPDFHRCYGCKPVRYEMPYGAGHPGGRRCWLQV